jgi:aminoglycoside N3'-acetyltransferase
MSKICHDYIAGLLERCRIPSGKILFLHVKLKAIQAITGASYDQTALELVNCLKQLFNPQAVLIPTFTYTYTTSRIYHRLFSRSEVGRFSEEIRQQHIADRTPDPIFNVIDISSELLSSITIDYKTAFGENSLYEYLDKQDCICFNIGLKELVSTQLHYVERLNNVGYRYDKVFPGIVYHDEKNWEHIDYTYYVRNLELNPTWNRQKIEKYLSSQGALSMSEKDNVKITWISAQSLRKAISLELAGDENFLIS